MDLVIFSGIGVIAGLLAGMMGISGGIFTVPCLTLYFRLKGFPTHEWMQLAVGTSLSAMTLNALSSVWSHWTQSTIRWSVFQTLLPGLLIGVGAGSLLARWLASGFLQLLFGFFAIGYGLFLFFRKAKKQPLSSPKVNSREGFLIGLLATLLGIGGGLLAMPLFIEKGIPEKQAIGTSALVGCLITCTGALTYLAFAHKETSQMPLTLGYIYLPAFGAIALTAALCAPIGALLAKRLSNAKLRTSFACVVVVIGLLMVAR